MSTDRQDHAAERWTPETQELLARTLHDWEEEALSHNEGTEPRPWADLKSMERDAHLDRAEPMLAALAEAGLLLPPGAEPRVETGISFRHGVSPCRTSCLQETEHVHDRERTVYVGPWVEVPHVG